MSSARVTATAAWGLTAVLLAVAWLVVLLGGPWEIGVMLAATAGVSCVVAAVMHTRIYVTRLCSLIRRTQGVAEPGASNVHAMR